MVKPLRLVHTSDVHVDNGALERPAADFPLRRVVDLVAAEAADLLLIAGDLFDSSRISAAAVERVLDELRRVPATTVVLPGNHDCYDGDSIYHRVDFRDAGSHVHALLDEDGETLEFPELHATVWGRAMVDHDAANRPLAGGPLRRGDYWHLGVAHGLVAAENPDRRSSPITPHEIGGSGLDYLALGHIHVFRDVSEHKTRACYSGSPGPAYGGAGPGSVALVTLDPASGVEIAERALD